MKPLHILHSEAATGWGGQEIRVFQESQLLLERGHRVSIICRPESPLAERCRKVSHPRFGFFSVTMDKVLSVSSFLSLYRLIGKIRPDILHTHSSIDSWLVSFVGKILNLPVIRSRHISIPVKNFFPNNWLYAKFPQRIITSGGAISDIVAGVNGVKRENVISVPAGVDLRRFDRNISGGQIREELKLSSGQLLIGKIGVIRGWKGHDYFLDAVPLILDKFPDARFVIVGVGPGYEEIKGKVQVRGLENAITMLGHREDVPEIMAALDVFVLASFAGEGTPQVICQAFAMNLPVVAARVGSTPDLLANGERGILVDPKNGRWIADGVLRLLNDSELSRRLTESAYTFCRKELTIEKMMDRTLEVYYEVLRAVSNA